LFGRQSCDPCAIATRSTAASDDAGSSLAPAATRAMRPRESRGVPGAPRLTCSA